METGNAGKFDCPDSEVLFGEGREAENAQQ